MTPDLGGTGARALLVLESPGPLANADTGSGFISPWNDDPSAEHVHHLVASHGIAFGDVSVWNVVPWWLPSDGDGSFRAPRATELRAGRGWLDDLLDLAARARAGRDGPRRRTRPDRRRPAAVAAADLPAPRRPVVEPAAAATGHARRVRSPGQCRRRWATPRAGRQGVLARRRQTHAAVAAASPEGHSATTNGDYQARSVRGSHRSPAILHTDVGVGAREGIQMMVVVASIVALTIWGGVTGVAVRRRRWKQALGGAAGLVLFITLAPTTCVVMQSYGGIAQCTNLLGLTTTAPGTTAGSTILGPELRAASPLLVAATIAALIPTLLARRTPQG